MPKATKKKSAIAQTERGAVVPPIPGTSLWFAAAICRLKGLDLRGPVGGDLNYIGVRMTESDRRRLVEILTGE
jgi:hypothetical protein